METDQDHARASLSAIDEAKRLNASRLIRPRWIWLALALTSASYAFAPFVQRWSPFAGTLLPLLGCVFIVLIALLRERAALPKVRPTKRHYLAVAMVFLLVVPIIFVNGAIATRFGLFGSSVAAVLIAAAVMTMGPALERWAVARGHSHGK